MSRKEATLANGTRVSCINPRQVSDIERQVQQYFRHGIMVQPGDTVFDVGANIGLFTLLVNEMCQGDVTVYAFEPIPAISAALRENLHNIDRLRLIPFTCGLSDQARSATFAFRPNMPTLSSAYGEDSAEMEHQVQDAWLRNLSAAPLVVRWLALLPLFLRTFIIKKAAHLAFASEQVECQLRRMSDVIFDEHVEKIDLLKVDVEKSELDVLLGLDDADWKRIRQVVLEIHDIDSRVLVISALLRRHGISCIVVEQERILRGSNVFALYATRPVILP